MIKPKHFLLLLVVISHNSECQSQIHIFGDSHSSFCFTNRPSSAPSNENSFFEYQNQNIAISIHCFVSKTMFSVGRDKLNAIDVKNFEVQENDVAVFVFGEIDARCHIGKQRDTKNRNLDEIIESLCQNFMTMIQQNKALINNLHCVVVSVLPPTNNSYNPDCPYWGSIEERVSITKLLNKKLEQLCEHYEFDFLDIYSLYANEYGALDIERSDKIVHVNPYENKPIKQTLIDYLNKKYFLFIPCIDIAH